MCRDTVETLGTSFVGDCQQDRNCNVKQHTKAYKIDIQLQPQRRSSEVSHRTSVENAEILI